MSENDYYPNVYFNEGHLEAQLKRISEIHNRIGEILDMRKQQSNCMQVMYSGLIQALKDAVYTLRVITTALDSQRPGMTYAKLSKLSGFKVSDVKFILKHGRPG